MITVCCEGCGTEYYADEKHIGAAIHCKNDRCRRIIVIKAPIDSSPHYERRLSARVHEPQAHSISSDRGSSERPASNSFIDRRPSVRHVLVILGISAVTSIITAILLMPRLTEPKATQEPKSQAETGSTDISGTERLQAKRPAIERPSKKEHFGVPDEVQPRVKAKPEADESISPTAPPRTFPRLIPKDNLQAQEIEPLNPRRLPTGAAPLGSGMSEGRCVVSVINGTDTDALVRVIQIDGGEQLFRNFYILARATFTAERFRAGNYILKVAFGNDWNEAEKKFNYRRSFEKTEPFTLHETTTTEPTMDGRLIQTRFSRMTVTLHKVLNGNFHSAPINEAEFWR